MILLQTAHSQGTAQAWVRRRTQWAVSLRLLQTHISFSRRYLLSRPYREVAAISRNLTRATIVPWRETLPNPQRNYYHKVQKGPTNKTVHAFVMFPDAINGSFRITTEMLESTLSHLLRNVSVGQPTQARWQ